MPRSPDENMGARSFAHLLTQIDEGSLNAELSETIREMASKLYDHANNHGGKAKGTLHLTIAMSAESNGTVSIAGEVKSKLPKVAHRRTVTWIDPSGHLVMANPRQIALPLREVPASAPTRTVDAETHEKRSL